MWQRKNLFIFCCSVDMKKIFWTVLIFHLQLVVTADRSVHILSENLDQVVTSTTLEWIPSSDINKDVLKNAVIAAYQTLEGKIYVICNFIHFHKNLFEIC